MPTTPDSGATEVVARSFGSENATGITLTPEQQRAQTKGAELRKKFEEVRDTDPLAALKRSESSANPLAGISFDTEIKRRMQESDDPRTDAMRTTMLNLANELKAISENGLSGVTDASRRDEIITQYVTQVLESRSAFSTLTPTERMEIAKAHFENPTTKEMLAKSLGEVLSPNTNIETGDTIRHDELIDEIKQGEQDRIQATQDIRAGAIRARELRQRQLDLSEPSADNPDGGVLYKRLNELTEKRAQNTNIVLLQTNVNGWPESTKQTFRTQVEQVIAANKAVGKETKETDFANEQARSMFKVMEFDNEGQELNQLINDKNTISEQIKNQDQQISKLMEARRDLIKNNADYQTELEEVNDRISQKEAELMENLQNMISNAGNEQMDNAVIERMRAFQKQLEDEAKASNDSDDKKLIDMQKNRWSYVDTSKAGHPRPKYLTYRQDSDWEQSLISGDVTSILKSMLIPLGTSTEERDRIEKRFTDNPEWVKQQSDQFIQNLITSRLMAGKVPYAGEVALLERNGWLDLIDGAINRNTAVKTAIESKLAAAGGHGRIDMLKHEYGDNWLAILGMLMAGMVAPGFVTKRLVNEELGRT